MPTDALIEQSLDSLVNGVSRQPAIQRLPSQAQNQLNVLSDVADGAERRPPLEHVAELSGDAATNLTHGAGEDYFVHEIDLGSDGQYIAIIEYGDIHVYDLSDGSEVTIVDSAAGSPGSYTYLADSSSGALTEKETFRAVTTGVDTYIVNRQERPGLSLSPSPGRVEDHEFLLHIKSGAPSANEGVVNLYFDGTDVGTGTGSAGDTHLIMDSLCTSLCGTANPSATNGTGGGSINDWTFTRIGDNLLYGYQRTGTNDTITASDEYGDSIHVLCATGPNGEDPEVAKFSDLPAKGKDDFVIKIAGDDGNSEDEFYVHYLEDRGVWRETRKPGLTDTIAGSGMPHALSYNSGTGQFTFQEVTWDDREVGDQDSAPVPSFLSYAIRDVFVHENRLSFLAGENASMSEAGNFTNFFPTTVTTLVESDPIDVAGEGGQTAIWDAAVPTDTGVTLFSDTGDVIGELIGARDKRLTVEDARIAIRGSYAHSDSQPVAMDRGVAYQLDRGGRTSFFQFQKVDVDLWDSGEFTEHVDAYVPGGLLPMSFGRAESILFAREAGSAAPQRNTLYVYRFHRVGNDNVMSSWSTWQFDDDTDIVDVKWIGSVAYFLIIRASGLHLEKMDFGKLDEDEGGPATPLGHRVHLDSLFKATGSYNVFTDETTWTVPYDQDTIGGTYRIVKAGEWGDSRAALITVKDATTDGSIVANGDHSANPVYIGRVYDAQYQLSQIVLRDRQGNGRIGGRLQLRRGRIAYANTGTFVVDVTSTEDADTYSVIFTPMIVGGAELGAAPLDDGVFEFDIGGRSDDVEITIRSDSHLPFTLVAFEWEGRFFNVSTRV